MKLYSIKAEAWSSVFGTPDNPNYGGSSNDCTSVAQKPDCSAFLFLTHTTQDDLEGLTLLFDDTSVSNKFIAGEPIK